MTEDSNHYVHDGQVFIGFDRLLFYSIETMFERLRQRWQGPGGCADVLILAFPLILNSSAHTIQMFVQHPLFHGD